MIVRLAAAGVLLMLAAPALAQDPSAPNDQDVTYQEQVVVTASKTEEQLVNAPAAVSVISTETIQNSPATNIGDLLRAVPGVNVSQVSARDINITTRGATSTLSTSQLALVDGRSVYLDFFGMVMWDLVPTNPDEIRQIEVIRGPASAIWGANAMSGVVNVITRSPRELARSGRGTQLTIGVGSFDRNATGVDAAGNAVARDQKGGSLFYVNGSHAEAVNDRWSFKLGAGYLTQDPLPRPVGVIPNVFGTPYPAFTNEGTQQPKFDVRVDRDLANNGGTVSFEGGVAGTQGLIHSGIGPFNIASGSKLGFFMTRYQKGGRRVAFFTNMLNGNATNLLAIQPNGTQLPLDFNTKTFDVEANDVKAVGTTNVFSYGGNFRHNTFDISIAPAPGESARNEGGAYLQDEIFLGKYFRWVVGGRADKFSSIDKAVFSPRTTLMIKPAADHTFRVSSNRAFRAPSFINNHIQTTILNQVDLSRVAPLPQLSPFIFPISASGNPDLRQETMTAYEVGYTGVVKKRATVTAAAYWNTTKDGIYFTPNGLYSATNPPPRWPLPPAVLTALAVNNPPVVLPSSFTYLNFGKIKDKGIELGVDGAVNRYLNLFTNYSYQWMPEASGLPQGTSIADINWPSKNRFNTGFDFSYQRFLGNASVNYTDSAYWQDVLDVRYAGVTKAYTMVNAAVGVRWAGDKIVTSLKVINLGNEDVQQHIFGDIVKRQIVGEARFIF
ncbi:MAG TPA: TonB-dependent receptor [Vicinamibacterales bacterium]|nr:TonB-dependent receptor [Vicinamibacterales bacterium]